MTDGTFDFDDALREALGGSVPGADAGIAEAQLGALVGRFEAARRRRRVGMGVAASIAMVLLVAAGAYAFTRTCTFTLAPTVRYTYIHMYIYVYIHIIIVSQGFCCLHVHRGLHSHPPISLQ